MSRGLPQERVFPWEIADPEVLKRYDVMLLSCPAATRGSLDEALVEWIRAGGRAYVETWPAMQAAYPLQEFVSILGNAPERCDVVVTTTDHPITQGLDPAKPMDLFHLTGTFIWPRQPDQARVLAGFCSEAGALLPRAGAVVCVPIGQGELVYSGAPLAFCCFHRGPTTASRWTSRAGP